MRARRFASRERQQFLIEDDLTLAREAMTDGRTGETTEPSIGSVDVLRFPSLSVKLRDLVEFGGTGGLRCPIERSSPLRAET